MRLLPSLGLLFKMMKLDWKSGCQRINLGIPRVLETFPRVLRGREKGRAKEVGSPIFKALIPSSEIFLLDLFHGFIFLPTILLSKTFSMVSKYLKIAKMGSF